MNKDGIQIRNDYFRGALFIKLIVNNVKYGGIHCDYGQLTKVLFIILKSLQCAAQKEPGFNQNTCNGPVCFPPYAGVLKKTGFTLLKSRQCDSIRLAPYAKAISAKSRLNNRHQGIGCSNLLSVIYDLLIPSNGLKSVLAANHGSNVKVVTAKNNRMVFGADNNLAESGIIDQVLSIPYAKTIRTATKENSTVYKFKPKSQKDSPVKGGTLKGNREIRLIPVIIDLSTGSQQLGLAAFFVFLTISLKTMRELKSLQTQKRKESSQ